MAAGSGDHVRDAARVALPRAFPGQPFQLLLRRLATLCLGRVLITQFVEREGAAVKDLTYPAERLRMALEQALDLDRILEMTVGVTFEAVAGLVDGAALPNAGDHILQAPARGVVVENVAHGNGRYPGNLRRLFNGMEAQVLVRREAPDQGHVGAIAESALETSKVGSEHVVSMVAQQCG